jgi:hypothetical protein
LSSPKPIWVVAMCNGDGRKGQITKRWQLYQCLRSWAFMTRFVPIDPRRKVIPATPEAVGNKTLLVVLDDGDAEVTAGKGWLKIQ